ncbi:hypothetical protein V8E54_004193 [Elaphomyces granulatus]
MDVPNIFDEFNSTIHKVLRGYQDHDTILHTLRCLAEGKESLIGHLPGIGNQPCATTPDDKYAQAMSVLLSWAIRTFPVQPSETLDHLWTTMAIIDGPKGYNQRLITKGLFDSAGILFQHPRPTVIPSWEPSPIDLDKENFRFVTDFLLANDNSRSAVASASRFGFQPLSVDCICLYVDTDNIEDLAAVAATSSTTIVIVKAGLCNCALADMETARGLIERPGLDKVQLSRRKFQLRQNRPQRCVTKVGPFRHGQSISLFDKESKGSVGVFLTPSEQSIAVMVEAKSKGPAQDAPPPAAEDESQSADVQPDVTGERLQPSLDREPLISPTTKALMLEKGVPISPIKGTGRGGQITREDVEKYKPSASAAGPTCEDIPLTSMHKTITSRLHDPSTSPVYALTAYHVLPFEEENESRVITPAGLDILTRLLISELREDELSFFLSRWNQKCGDVKFGGIGTNSKDWRVDFALFSMEDGFRGQNGLFFDRWNAFSRPRREASTSPAQTVLSGPPTRMKE